MNTREYGGIDRFRLVAAFLIVGIHTFPLTSVSETLNFAVVNVIARIGVPFFMMVTGYFVLPRSISPAKGEPWLPTRYLKKTLLAYAGVTILYLPVSIYAGHFSKGNIPITIIKDIIFDGTFYHLWYFPALIIGITLICVLSRKLPLKAIIGVSAALYMLGLLGDSYYGIATKIPFAETVYDMGFRVFSYTRNGIFYAPIFLAMGAAIAKSERDKSNSRQINLLGFLISIALMLTEGLLLHRFSHQRHDSMYIALIPCMYFLFKFLLTYKTKTSHLSRGASMWIYILHPLFIVAILPIARIAHLTRLLVDNSIVHYIAICLLSFASAALIIHLLKYYKRGRK